MAWTPPTQAEVDGYFDKLNNWGRWGEADQVGTLNLITQEKRQAVLRVSVYRCAVTAGRQYRGAHASPGDFLTVGLNDGGCIALHFAIAIFCKLY